MTGKHYDNDTPWLLESGASHHMTGIIDHLFDCSNIPPFPVSLPDGVHTTATTQGSVRLSPTLVLHNVLFMPNIKCNHISVGQLSLDALCYVTFTDCFCVLQDRTTRMSIGLGEARNRTDYFRPDTTFLLHQRLGHPLSQHLAFISSSSNK